VEDVELWLSEIEGQLMSEDYGKVCLWFLFQQLCCDEYCFVLWMKYDISPVVMVSIQEVGEQWLCP
jgi:hypothetical protein